MELGKFAQHLPGWAVRHEVEETEGLRADERARQRERFEREMVKLDAALARAEARQAARQERETEELYEWMKRNGPQRRERRGSQAGSGQTRRGGVRNTPQELRSMLADARKNGHERLASLLQASLQRAEGKDVQPPLEHSSTPGATVRVV